MEPVGQRTKEGGCGPPPLPVRAPPSGRSPFALSVPNKGRPASGRPQQHQAPTIQRMHQARPGNSTERIRAVRVCACAMRAGCGVVCGCVRALVGLGKGTAQASSSSSSSSSQQRAAHPPRRGCPLQRTKHKDTTHIQRLDVSVCGGAPSFSTAPAVAVPNSPLRAPTQRGERERESRRPRTQPNAQ
jgi:hypothetical protein